jgi:phosphoribosylamine--glycine ligase
MGLDEVAQFPGVIPFHAGTRRDGDRIVTSGGRVLGITAFVKKGTLQDAIQKAYRAVDVISFEGMHFRRDIGRAISGKK